jgi:hypothetical protein
MTSSRRAPMRRALGAAIIALGTIAGCAKAVFYNAITPTTRDATYACTARQMTKLGYQVDVPDGETGATVGDRASGQHGFANMGHIDHDRLTATVIAVDSASVRLQILATTVRITTFLDRSQIQTVKTTTAVRADATTVLNACAGSMAKVTGS